MINDDFNLDIHFINVAPIKLFDSVNFASDKLRNREEVVVEAIVIIILFTVIKERKYAR